MGGIAPPKPPRCYNILPMKAATSEEENIGTSRFAIKVDGNSVGSGVKTNENCWNENTCRVNFNNYRLAKGCSRLMYACQQGLIDTVVRELRTKPGRIRQRDSSNKSVLHYCSGQRNLLAAASVAVAAPELLESADEDGFTPLHLAVIQGNLAMVNLLLANKADVNAVDNEGHSVVHWATVCGEVEALRSVLQAGANVKIPDINGGSPLHYAAQMCGANYDNKLGQSTSSKLALEILDILLAHPQSSVDITDKDGRKPLLWAASAGSAKAVLALVKAGSRVESADKDGLTALHCAASRGHTECIDTIISLCGAPTDLIDSNGCTALHYAVTLGHADATSRLLDLDADPNRQDRKGRTPAHCGCSKGQLETVKLLKEWGANLWLRNAKGDLPVHEAALSGRRELVEWLLEQKPKHVNTTSNDGRSLLHIAASNDYTDICKLLLDYGADVNSILRNSKSIAITPLDCALQKGFRSTAKFLQSNGGLPASKLRLSARRSNAFNDQDLVKPLKYIEKEELHNIKGSKRNVMHSKRSDSESGGQCSCNEHTYKKEHTFSHTCRHHSKRFRRRTSSCGEAKNYCREDSCSDICRSKSNIEIHRKKSRERVSSNESEFDSCENCCYHKRKHKLKRKERATRRTKVLRDVEHDFSDNNDTDDPKFDVPKGKNRITNPKIIADTTELPLTRPSSKTSNKSRPSSSRKQTDEVTKNLIGTEEATAISMTDEEESPDRVEQVVVTQADVHVPAVEENLSPENCPAELELEPEVRPDQAFVSETSNDVSSKEVIPDSETPHLAIKSTENDGSTNDKKHLINDNQIIDYDLEKSETVQKSSENDSNMQTDAVEANEQIKEDTTRDNEKAENAEEQCIIPSDLEFNDNENQEIALTGATSELQGNKEVPQDKNEEKEINENVYPSESPTKDTEILLPEAEKLSTEKAEGTASIEKLKSSVEEENLSEKLNTAIQLTQTEEQTQPYHSSQLAEEYGETLPNQNQASQPFQPSQSSQPIQKDRSMPSSPVTAKDTVEGVRDQESRRSFTLLPDSPENLESQSRKSSFQVLKSDESVDVDDVMEQLTKSDMKPFKIVDGPLKSRPDSDVDVSGDIEEKRIETNLPNSSRRMLTSHSATATTHGGYHEYNNGRKRRLKKRIKSGGTRGRSYYKMTYKVTNPQIQQSLSNKDHDSGFEPSPRATKTKIPTPRNMYTAHLPRKAIYATLDGRLCSSRLENRRPGDKGACDMSAVTRSIQRNIRRYYMERKIFQHLLELKSLQIRSNKLNEAVLVKRAVDEYHKSCIALGGETGTTLRRYSYSEYTFKNFELFLYDTLKALQRPGTFNFQNINDVYEEAERRLSPDYNAYEKALQCTTKTHRCLHATHAYTGIPCAAYIPMMNHHTMPKFGFGPYKKSSAGSFYLPKILSSNPSCGSKVSLELSHGKNKQLISLPSEKLDSNKRYYVTFTVKESGGKQQLQQQQPQQLQQQGSTTSPGDDAGVSEKTCDQKKGKEDRDDK